MITHKNKTGHVLFALLVIAAGILLLTSYTGLLSPTVKSIIFSWQTLLIAIGTVLLVQRRNQSLGIILTIIGAVFLLPVIFGNIYPFHGNGRALSWAIILILIGIYLLFKVIFGKHHLFFCFHHHGKSSFHHSGNYRTTYTSKDSSEHFERNYVFGGGKEKISTSDFKGGEINCVFGGMELDLSDAQLAEGSHTLEINTVFGGITLFVPTHWKVDIRPTNVFGSFEDKRVQPYFDTEENKRLIIEITSVFGGGEIRSK
ncbi:MAG: cell wall-active antibiotics response protein [Bacteroidales bacterium]|nr:cell wall-active antibiotics response protein [Bacteroidales bacterium]MCL2739076.1 cell wall-active antibiotics response protein [Bacteroidales bacterium]